MSGGARGSHDDFTTAMAPESDVVVVDGGSDGGRRVVGRKAVHGRLS